MTSPSTPNTISGRNAFIELLQSEGVTHLFGNPGTTELPIMHALADYPDMRYVLGLQEAIVVAMADGYARASGELVACNVHVAPGLGNAMGSLFTAFNSGTPLIITAGQQEQGHGLTEPLLYAPLVPIATPVVKWATEVTRLEDLPRIVHRAAKIATTPPTGPVFISLPGDILNAFGVIDLDRRHESIRAFGHRKTAFGSWPSGSSARSGRSSSPATRSSVATPLPRPPVLPKSWVAPSMIRRCCKGRISQPTMRPISGRCRATRKPCAPASIPTTL